MIERITFFKDKKGDYYLLEAGESGLVCEEQEGGEEVSKKLHRLREKMLCGTQGLAWEAYLEQFCQVAAELPNYKKELGRLLSDIDMQICDIMHYIEFYEMDTEKSVRMVKLLQESRKQRREVKDELLRTEQFQKSLGTVANLKSAKAAIRQMDMLDTRIYHPRKLGDLFET